MFAQVQIFGKYTPEEKTLAPDINIFGYGQKLNQSSTLKMTYFALVEENWAEGLIGVSYAPKDWLELGLLGGIETTETLYRFCASVWLGKDKFSLLTFFEKGDGKDNWWYKSTLSYQIAETWSTGLMSWRYNGTGVFVKKDFKTFSVWVNPAYDLEFEKERLTMGIDIKI
ncbi:MAG: hypothetical protein K9M44_03185 [Candidatus Pacebacteria bacterium]|nr:hypothetical protein [Candidatus Paceibacterota bacterium]